MKKQTRVMNANIVVLILKNKEIITDINIEHHNTLTDVIPASGSLEIARASNSSGSSNLGFVRLCIKFNAV